MKKTVNEVIVEANSLILRYSDERKASSNESSGKGKRPLRDGLRNPLIIDSSSSEGEGSGGGVGLPLNVGCKRPRLVWSPHMHKRFVDAVAQLGIMNAVPNTIMQLMGINGLSRENVARHLHKYRLYVRRMQDFIDGTGPGSGDSAKDHLFASCPIPAQFLKGPAGRPNSDHSMPYMPLPGSQLMQQQLVQKSFFMKIHHHHHLGNSWSTMEEESFKSPIFLTANQIKFFDNVKTQRRLLSALQDVKVNKIGIYGSGGIGKTTMLKKLYYYSYRSYFNNDLVLWVTVPKCSTRRKMQNALLQQLSLNVATIMSDDEVAVILHQTLLGRKFVLLLDDVREHVDLPKLGISCSLNTDYKIVLTTRSFHICESMGMDKIIKAEVLSEEQSLKLFLSNVGHVMDSWKIELYGRAIVDQCAGLPLTIKVVGKALRADTSSILVWKCALKKMLMSNNNNLEVLKLGYDRLEEHDMRSCFLFSFLFTESKAIKVSSLVEYLIDDGFVVGTKSHAHRRGYDIVKHLIDVSLLECTDDGLMVEMHDVIRDLALMILSDAKGVQMLLSRYSMSVLLSQEAFLSDMRNPAFGGTEQTETAKLSSSGDPHCVLKGGDGLEEPPPEEELEEAKMVFLMDNNLTSLPSEPNCSKLQILFLQRNENLRTIPSSFFENMSSLQILNLSKTRIKDLPQSLSKLQILQVLILRNCERLLFLPSAIGDLKQLLVLDVHGTEICQLPDEIGELLSLVHLQLCFYGSMDEDECDMLPSQLISKGVISKFSRLRELSIIVYPGDPRWTKIASDVTIEVSNLELCSLSFHFPEVQHFKYFINASPAWLHQTLTRFNFTVGHDVKRVVSHVCDDLEQEYSSQDRCLRFVDGEDIPDAINEALYQATAFYLDHHQTAHSLTQFAWAAIKGLKFCIVKDCPKLKAIINSRKSTEHYFPVLEFLSIHYSWKLSQIWVGPIRAGSLSMLRKLSLHSCPILEFILSPHMVAVLSNLEELIVVDCQSLKTVISNQDQKSADEDVGDSDNSEPNVSDLNSMQDNAEDVMEIDLPKAAELRIKVLKLHHLPDLVNIWSGGDLPCLEYVSVYHCPRLRNLNLKSHVEVTIKEIKTETDWWDNLEWENPALPAKLQDRVKEIQCDDI